MNITIKGIKSFKEQAIKTNGIDFIVGARVYKSSELKRVRKEYLALLDNRAITSLQDQMILETDERVILNLADDLENLSDQKEKALFDFYKKQIVFLKNISLDLDGVDLFIPDTRLAEPVEGLWDSPESCLVVLLDLYFEETSIALLLQQAVTTIVFDASYKEEVIKN
jgi:hypothetical protein